MNVAIDEVRRAEAAQKKRDGYEPILTKSRWWLLKRRENLTDNQEIKLTELLEYNLKSGRAHLLRELSSSFGITKARLGPGDSSIRGAPAPCEASWCR